MIFWVFPDFVHLEPSITNKVKNVSQNVAFPACVTVAWFKFYHTFIISELMDGYWMEHVMWLFPPGWRSWKSYILKCYILTHCYSPSFVHNMALPLVDLFQSTTACEANNYLFTAVIYHCVWIWWVWWQMKMSLIDIIILSCNSCNGQSPPKQITQHSMTISDKSPWWWH